jgi:hypothetical protein
MRGERPECVAFLTFWRLGRSRSRIIPCLPRLSEMSVPAGLAVRPHGDREACVLSDGVGVIGAPLGG